MAGEIYFNNLSGKFDWGSIIDQIIKIKSLPIQRLSKEAQQIQAKQSATQKLLDAVKGLSKVFENLTVDNLFKGKRAESSDSSVLTATASENTPNVALNVDVLKLAQKEALATTFGVNDINDTISWDSFTLGYNLGNYQYEYFTVDAGSGKLQDLVNAINEKAGSRIVASIFYDGTSYKLMLSEKDEKTSSFETTIDGSTAYTTIFYATPFVINGQQAGAIVLQNAQNAQIRIGNTTITSTSNTFENLITGLNVEVKKVGSATIRVSDDYSRVVDFFNNFVKNYNAVISQINQLTAKDAIFQGDYSIVGIKTELSRMLDDLFAYDLVSIKEDGTLEANTSNINSLASSNPQKLREIISRLKDTMGPYVLGTSIALQNFTNDYQSRLDQINTMAQKLGEQLVKEEQRLRQEYAKVEAFINRSQEIMARLQSFIVSLSEMQGGKK
ncbi:MAG: flagellar filament capping protein FliD [Aquificaceae bacterium]|nr:flagellar filament capping protein FliD [Aquificaceae bacterium]